MHISLKSNRDETKITYDKVCEKLDNIIIDVCNFVYDITPDYILNDNKSLPNPNAMIELGFAL